MSPPSLPPTDAGPGKSEASGADGAIATSDVIARGEAIVRRARIEARVGAGAVVKRTWT